MGSWLPTWPAEATAPIIVCLPPAGGDTSAFHSWRRARTDIHVVPAELPGHRVRLHESPFDSVADMAASLAEELRGVAVERIWLLGTSLGAIVAFETARALRDCNVIAGVTVVSCPGPGLMSERLGVGRLARGTLEAFRQLGGNSEATLSPDLVRVFLPSWRADMRAGRTYAGPADDEPLAVPIHVVRGDRDHFVIQDDVRDWAARTILPTHEVVSGQHFVWDRVPPPWLTALVDSGSPSEFDAR